MKKRFILCNKLKLRKDECTMDKENKNIKALSEEELNTVSGGAIIKKDAALLGFERLGHNRFRYRKTGDIVDRKLMNAIIDTDNTAFKVVHDSDKVITT